MVDDILKIIEKRIIVAEEKRKASNSLEMDAFWDGQIRCGQFLLSKIGEYKKSATKDT